MAQAQKQVRIIEPLERFVNRINLVGCYARVKISLIHITIRLISMNPMSTVLKIRNWLRSIQMKE